MTDLIRQFYKDESGATAIEYGLCVLILLGAIIAIVGTGGAVDGMYQKLTAIIRAIS